MRLWKWCLKKQIKGLKRQECAIGKWMRSDEERLKRYEKSLKRVSDRIKELEEDIEALEQGGLVKDE